MAGVRYLWMCGEFVSQPKNEISIRWSSWSLKDVFLRINFRQKRISKVMKKRSKDNSPEMGDGISSTDSLSAATVTTNTSVSGNARKSPAGGKPRTISEYEETFVTMNERPVDDISLDFFYKPHTITLLLMSIVAVMYFAFVR